MMPFISTFEIINVILSDPNIFLWIAASVADAAPVNPKGIKTYLGNGFSIFFVVDKLVFSNGSKSLPKNPSDCAILCNWVCDNFLLGKEWFAEAL